MSADCGPGGVSNSCWKRFEEVGFKPVAVISRSTSVEALRTASQFGMDGINRNQGSVAFLSNQIERMSSNGSISFFPGEEECVFFDAPLPQPGTEFSIENCEAVRGSVITLLTLHYICDNPGRLIRGFSDIDRQCPYAIANELGSNESLKMAFANAAIATAALIDDPELYSRRPWSSVFSEKQDWLLGFNQTVNWTLDERFDRYKFAIKFAQGAAVSKKLPAATQLLVGGNTDAVQIIVGNKFSSRAVEAGEIFSSVAQTLTSSNEFRLRWETTLLEPLDFARRLCAGSNDSISAVIVDASAFDALRQEGCPERIVPVARIASEDFFFAASSGKVSSDVAPWFSSATLGIASEMPDGTASADQLVLEFAKSSFGSDFGDRWTVVEYETGGLATESLADGVVDLTLSNPFEILANTTQEPVFLTPITDVTGVPFHDLLVGKPPVRNVIGFAPDINVSNNYFIALTGAASSELKEYLANLSVAITVSPEWRDYLTEHAMTEVETAVEGSELMKLEDFFKP